MGVRYSCGQVSGPKPYSCVNSRALEILDLQPAQASSMSLALRANYEAVMAEIVERDQVAVEKANQAAPSIGGP
jgi:hypothetical protein